MGNGNDSDERGISKRLKQWLVRNPDRCTGLFVVYPQTNTEGEITSVFVQSLCTNAINSPAQFRFSDRVVYQLNGKLAILINRNVAPPKDKKFLRSFKPFKITIQGELPENTMNEFWEVHADLIDGKMTLVKAVKLADRKPVSKKAIKRSELVEGKTAA